jgi:uncharacterized membrane protein
MVVTARRLRLYLSIGLAYLFMLIILEKFVYPSTTIYHSMDFEKAPLQASICGIIVITVWIAASLAWPILTKMRLDSV